MLEFCNVDVKAFGPVQLYVAPATNGVVKFITVPAHTGVLLPVVGVAGAGFTTTVVVPAALVQPPTVTVTEYVPAIARVEAAVLGFCKVEVNVFGPVQLYVAPATNGVVKLIAVPTHTGVLLITAGVVGIGLTTTVVVPIALVQPLTVTVTEYVPAIAKIAGGVLGFCNVEEDPNGPVQLYVAPATKGVAKFITVPSHTGELLLAVGVAGVGFTTTVVVPAALVQPDCVMVTE